jgi:hypothetical protein
VQTTSASGLVQELLPISRASSLARDLARNLAAAHELDLGRNWSNDPELMFRPDFLEPNLLKPKLLKPIRPTRQELKLQGDNIVAIGNYLNLLTRMHDCKQAALRVSREKWEGLCARVCRPLVE